MLAYRIAQTHYIRDLSGFGAFQYGGRWNSKGVRMLYLADSPSLALLEVLVHIPNFEVETPYSLLTVEIPDNIPIAPTPPLPKNWQLSPPPTEIQEIGNQFIANNKFLLMKMPSCIVPMCSTYLVNPLHPDSEKISVIKVEVITIEPRLLGIKMSG